MSSPLRPALWRLRPSTRTARSTGGVCKKRRGHALCPGAGSLRTSINALLRTYPCHSFFLGRIFAVCMFTGCNALIGFLQLVTWLLSIHRWCGEVDPETSPAGERGDEKSASRLRIRCRLCAADNIDALISHPATPPLSLQKFATRRCRHRSCRLWDCSPLAFPLSAGQRPERTALRAALLLPW